MAAAHNAGYSWPSTCGGDCECTTCAVIIMEGRENIEEMGRGERKALVLQRSEAAIAKYRLACQTRVHGDIIVEKFGVRQTRW